MATDEIEERLQGLEAHYEHLPKAWKVGVDQLVAQVRVLRQRIAEVERERDALLAALTDRCIEIVNEALCAHEVKDGE